MNSSSIGVSVGSNTTNTADFEILDKTKDEDLSNVPEPIIEYQDMKQEMLEFALYQGKLAYISLSRGRSSYYQDAAKLIKESFEQKYSPTWHCIIGTNYGSYCSYELGKIIYMKIGHLQIVLFKHT